MIEVRTSKRITSLTREHLAGRTMSKFIFSNSRNGDLAVNQEGKNDEKEGIRPILPRLNACTHLTFIYCCYEAAHLPPF